MELPEEAVSRAYLKMQEGLRWAALPCSAGDHWVELGCAPGGASQALLDADMLVTGVDPAEVDPALLEHERFQHVRAKSSDAARRLLAGCHWMAADLNVAPNYTLEAVETLLASQSISPRGMLLTLKLLDWKLAAPDLVREYIERVKSWATQTCESGSLHTTAESFAWQRCRGLGSLAWTNSYCSMLFLPF